MNTSPLNILIPEVGGRPQELVPLAQCLLDAYGGHATLLSVVTVPADRSLSEGALVARRKRARLQRRPEVQDNPNLRAEVRTSHTIAAALRAAAVDSDSNLMLFRWRSTRQQATWDIQQDIIDDPPCDVAVVKQGASQQIESVLVAARGGPHARLALRIAEGIAAANGAVLTLLHINLALWDEPRRAHEAAFFNAVLDSVTYFNVRPVQVEAESVEEVLLQQGTLHDLVVMGASGRDDPSSYLFGRITTHIARRLTSTVIVVKTREPVTDTLFGLPSPAGASHEPELSEAVDAWFAQNTFHSSEFKALSHLVELKERQGLTISLALPTLNEEKTVGKILASIQRNLVERVPLIDELLVIDSNSTDRTAEIVTEMGVSLLAHPDILPQYGSVRGKGEALWKSLYATQGDIIVWVDSDITGFNPKFVYGLLGPLLSQPHVGFVKGFYRRPLNLGGHISTTGGGRVTELTARPLINLFYPQLSGVVQPLAGEMAGRRSVLEDVPFFTGYGVETGLLIDILERFGIRSIAQTDLEVRVHRNQTLLSLSKMAFAIVQVVVKRLGESKRLELLSDINTSMKLIHYAPSELFLEVQEVRENERQPMNTLPEYCSSRRNVVGGTGAKSGEMEQQK